MQSARTAAATKGGCQGHELDRAFDTLTPLTTTPTGIYYGNLMLDPYLDPLRNDPRFDKLLAELAPRD